MRVVGPSSFIGSTRGYGVKEYRGLLKSGEANRTRLKTPSEFKRADLASTGFGATITRHVLFTVGRVAEQDKVKDGMTGSRPRVTGYWDQCRTTIVPLLDFLGRIDTDHWGRDAAAARLLRGAVDIGWGPRGTRSHNGAIVLDSFGIDRSHSGRNPC